MGEMPDLSPVHPDDDYELSAAVVALSRLIERQPVKQAVARWIVRVLALQQGLYVPIIGDHDESVEDRIGQAGRALLEVVRDGLAFDETHLASRDASRTIVKQLRREDREIREAWAGPPPGEEEAGGEDTAGDQMTRQEKDREHLLTEFQMVASEIERAIHIARRSSRYGGPAATRAALEWALGRVQKELVEVPTKTGGMISPTEVTLDEAEDRSDDGIEDGKRQNKEGFMTAAKKECGL